jgi:hypothetical protein
MADLTLRLRVDPTTGKREIVIDYISDSDALPMEHEEQHRELAEKVIEGGLRGNKKVEVSREQDGQANEAPAGEVPAGQEPTANKR